jgi:hypothetical protein
MYKVRLENGTVLHAYKHIYTRCYLFLTEDGRAFSWTPCERYAPMRLDWAIEAALCSWWFLDGWDAETPRRSTKPYGRRIRARRYTTAAPEPRSGGGGTEPRHALRLADRPSPRAAAGPRPALDSARARRRSVHDSCDEGPRNPALLVQRPRQRLHDRGGDTGGQPQKPRHGTHQAAVADCADAKDMNSLVIARGAA